MHTHIYLAHETLEMHVSLYDGSNVSQLVLLQELDLTLDIGAQTTLLTSYIFTVRWLPVM